MDEYEYLDQFFYSPTWSDNDLKQRSAGLCCESGQPNGFFASSVGTNERDNINSHTSVINSNGSNETLAAQDASSVVLGSESDYGIDMGLNSGEDDQNAFFANPSNGMVNGDTLGVTSLAGCQYDMAAIAASGDIRSSSLPYPEVGHAQCNGLEPSDFQSFQTDFQTLSPIPDLSPVPPFEGISSLSPGMGVQDRIGGFGLQGGDYFENDFYAMESHSANLSASLSSKETQRTYGLQNYPLSSFASGPQTTTTAVGLQSLLQTASTTPPGESNGAGKPARVRARRGQATDPHSIAERLRREKIADRMKSLQELLPNPNKTDKASMLDEIIDYVKFLQLQVKVLSSSRLGATDTVEGGNGLLLSPSSGEAAEIAFPSDEIAFERELVKLMESNVTKAMQYLQTKSLCLVPVGLASAVSAGKEKESSLSAPLSDDRRRNGIHQMPSHGNTMMRNATIENNIVVSNKCVAAAAKPAEEGNKNATKN